MSRSQPGLWWEDAVTYQIYPRSFRDTTGSGIGDLRGITESLDYVADLGVDAIWLSPFYPSPQVDSGYDVSDYCGVDPMFGTLQDFDEMVEAAHARNLRVIIDLVPNHSSDKHPLFQAALQAEPGSPERAFYHFEDQPNNWRSVFGGSSWTQHGDQWFYHLFAPEQPDFNWDNPAVADYFEQVLRFWLDRGVDGFRIDVSDALIKDVAWLDTEDGLPVIPKGEDSAVHDVYRRFRRILDDYPGERMAVLETGAPDDVVALFLRPDEMHQAFNLRFVKTPWSADAFRQAIDESQAALDHVTWVTDNHDNTRSVSRFGAGQTAVGEYVPEVEGVHPLTEDELVLGTRRARALAPLLLFLPGAAYIYQGQELGLPEAILPDEVLTDPVFFRSGGKQRGRDGCRVPMPWSGSTAPFGFTEGEPWLPIPSDWHGITVASQEEAEDSMLAWYRSLLRLRHEEPALGTGQMRWLDSEAEVLRLRLSAEGGRSFDLVVNFGDGPVRLPAGPVVAASRELGWTLGTDSEQSLGPVAPSNGSTGSASGLGRCLLGNASALVEVPAP